MTKNQTHRFITTVTGCNAAQAETVMGERLLHDEDYGFNYIVDYASMPSGTGVQSTQDGSPSDDPLTLAKNTLENIERAGSSAPLEPNVRIDLVNKTTLAAGPLAEAVIQQAEEIQKLKQIIKQGDWA